MVKTTAKNIILICTGLLIFIAPLKFGMPIDFDNHEIWTIGLVILFALWLIWGVVSGKVRIRYSFLDISILIFLASACISAFKAPNIHKAHLCLTQYLSYAAVYFLILNILEDEKDLRFLLSTMLFSAVLISIYAIYQYYIGLPETREFASQYLSGGMPDYIKDRLASNRVFSTFIYPNTLAGYLFLCIPLALVIKKRWIRVLTILILIYALTLTFYRGSGSVNKITNTLIFRWQNWTAGLRMIEKYPLFGVGTYNFSIFYPLYKLDIAEEVQNAHNNFLQIFAEQGVIGFISFCAIWIIAIKKGIRMWGLSLGLIAFIIHNMIDFDWYVPGLTIIVWVFMGILVWGSQRYREKAFVINRWLGLLIILPIFIFTLFHLERVLIGRRYFQEARKALGNKDLPLGEVLSRASIRMDRDNPEAYFLLGRISNNAEWYKAALEYNPYNSFYYYNMGLFKEAVDYYPTNPFYRLGLARFYETSGQADLALKEYKYCLELNNKLEKESQVTSKMLKHLILPKKMLPTKSSP